ncbi:MAG: hypothetical protein H6Q18_629 [Bacteroidetes bacterium]|nr:hypothetical protein [Bacteroidota bacterium]
MSRKSGIEAIKNFFLKVKARLISKDALTFLIFLVLSSAFWFVHSLGRERMSTINIPINYTGIPEDVQILNKLPEKITIVIRDEGLRLLEYSKNKAIPMSLDLTRVYFEKGNILISTDQLKGRLSRYVLPTTAVLSIQPDSISIDYQKLTTKQLKIKLNSQVSLATQHIYSDSIRIEPSTVKVFGPKHVIDTMKAVYTDKINITDLSDTILVKSKLKRIKGVRYSFEDVSIGFLVEMFTEKQLQIPVTVINSPEKLNIKVFPARIDVTFNIGLSNFNKIKPNDIQAVFDYNEVKNSPKQKNKLHLINNSPYISNIRFSPDEVEFLLEDK